MDNTQQYLLKEKREIVSNMIDSNRRKIEELLETFDSYYKQMENDLENNNITKVHDYLNWLNSEINDLIDSTCDYFDESSTKKNGITEWNQTIRKFMPLMILDYMNNQSEN